MTEPTHTPRPPFLEVTDLRVRFGAREVLAGLSFSVGRGEIFGLLGANGAGKSTSLQVLCGLLRPSGGALRFDGETITPGDRRLRARLGVVFQGGSLDGKLTARENLALCARLFGLPRAEGRARAEALLAWAELADRADEAVGRYSGGMRRRIEIARALLPRPDLLLLDEPTAGLDETAFRNTWEKLVALRAEEGLTVLLTTHRAEEAERCDRLALIDGGRAVATGTPDALKARVAGDVITLDAADPEALVAELRERLGVEARVAEGAVVVEREKGHELVPRLVEALPAGRLRSVGLRRPGLADAFVKLTGHALGAGTLAVDGGDGRKAARGKRKVAA